MTPPEPAAARRWSGSWPLPPSLVGVTPEVWLEDLAHELVPDAVWVNGVGAVDVEGLGRSGRCWTVEVAPPDRSLVTLAVWEGDDALEVSVNAEIPWTFPTDEAPVSRWAGVWLAVLVGLPVAGAWLRGWGGLVAGATGSAVLFGVELARTPSRPLPPPVDGAAWEARVRGVLAARGG